MNGPEAAAAKALISDFATRIRPASKQDPPFDPKGLNAKERAVLRRLWSQVAYEYKNIYILVYRLKC
jgi:hypothetical protein